MMVTTTAQVLRVQTIWGNMDTEGGRKIKETLSTYPGPAPLLKMKSRRITEKWNRKDYNTHFQ